MTTMALLRPLLPLLFVLLSLLHNHNVALASAKDSSSGSSTTLQCQSGWTRSSKLQTISPDKINDGYCDCPLDGLDEIDTGACSGSMDGMWAGIPPVSSSLSSPNDSHAAVMFICPQQPSLHLPPSRINDGICDCCDGADEQQPTTSSQQRQHTTCPDVCDTVLAAEREARQKIEQDYALGSEGRQKSIRQFQKWQNELQLKIKTISDRDIGNLERRVEDAQQVLNEKRNGLVKEWTLAVDEVLSHSTLEDIVSNSNGNMDVHKLELFIVSLCQLSGEVSADQVVNGRCLPLDRASLDVGILWDNDDDGDGNGSSLPSFHVFDAESEESITDYAEKLILRLEGKDSRGATRRAAKKSNHVKRSHPEPDSDDFDDEDHDYYDDDYMDDPGEYINEHDSQDENEDKKEGENPTVKFLLDKLPLLAVRDAFKEHGNALLASSGTYDNADNDAEAEEGEGDSLSKDDASENGVDPMALSMARSTISKRLGNINRGESSSRSAARCVAALKEKSSSGTDELQILAIMTMYHSKLSLEGIAEIIYTLTFPSDQQGGNEQTCSDVRPWSKWCPPATMVAKDGGKSYPPSILVAAAERICSQRDNAAGVCSGEGEEEMDVEFPLSVPDGYYAYYEPKARTTTDELSPLFAAMDSLHMPGDFTIAKDVLDGVETKLESKRNELSKLEKDLDSSDASKYGIDGELFMMRDSCHKIESGKYEYEVCIFGKATQRDIGQKGGGTNLGSWDKVIMENGNRTLKWDKGMKCWNGPVRSAEVVVTCGRTTRLLSADEPETCRYVFTMESPIACDEQFKVNNSL